MIQLNEERLAALPFLDYLKEMLSKIKSISHRPKTSYAYSEARELCRHIKHRFVQEYHLTWEDFDLKTGRHLRLSEDVLDKYRYCKSDKAKTEVIREFVKEYSYDLNNMILARERHKENPGTPIQDDEV